MVVERYSSLDTLFQCSVEEGACESGLNFCVYFLIPREHPNVTKMKILGCDLVSVTRGTRTLKDAVDSAFEEYLVSSCRAPYRHCSRLETYPLYLYLASAERPSQLLLRHW